MVNTEKREGAVCLIHLKNAKSFSKSIIKKEK